MSKYCPKCGKKLAEGEKCDCKGANSSFDFNECVNSLVKILKGVFVKPFDTIKEFATASNFVLGWIGIAIVSIITGLVTYAISKEFLGLLMGGFAYGLGGSAEVPFFKTFFMGVLFSVVGYATLAGMIVLMSKLFKGKVDFKATIALLGVCSIFAACVLAVPTVLVLISLDTAKVAALILLLGMSIHSVYVIQGIEYVTGVDKNRLALVYVPAVAVELFVVGYILPKLF